MKHLATLSLLTLGTALFLRAETVAGVPPPSAGAAKVLDVFDRLRAAQEGKPDAPKNAVFNVTEADVNEYLRYSLKATPRPGVESMTVKFLPNDYISTFTKVDFDAVEKWNPGTIPTVLRPVLKGKKAVWIDVRIHAVDSNITFSVEKARYDDVPLPPYFVEKVIQ